MHDPIHRVDSGDLPAAPAVALDLLRPGTAARIVGIDRRVADQLRRDGLEVGETVSVAGRAPFGGALIVGLDRVRVAIPIDLARAVSVVPLPGSRSR